MLLIGIDQSPKKHDICITDAHGRQLAQGTVANALAGFEWIHQQCQRLAVAPQECLVALESAYDLVVDFLLDHGYQVYAVPGRAMKSFLSLLARLGRDRRLCRSRGRGRTGRRRRGR